MRPIFDSHCNPTSMISSTHFVRDKNRRCSHDRRVLSVAKAKAALVFRVLVDSRTLPLKENECKDSNPCSAPVLWRFVANGFRLVTHSNFLSLSLSLPPYIFCFSLFLLSLSASSVCNSVTYVRNALSLQLFSWLFPVFMQLNSLSSSLCCPATYPSFSHPFASSLFFPLSLFCAVTFPVFTPLFLH